MIRSFSPKFGFLAGLLAFLPIAGPAAGEFDGKIERDTRDSTPSYREAPAAPPDAPNVVLVLIDDLGFGDLGSYGSEIPTPHIDRLAENGLRFTNFTVTAICSPTRAALLTGLNHHNAGVGFLGNFDLGYPGYRGEIDPDVMTLAEILRGHGYSTLMTGKWHLLNAAHQTQNGPFDNWPTGRGFERFWGFLDGETNQFHPSFLVSGNEFVETLPDDFYFPDAMTDRAIRMLRTQHAVAPGKPFFLYYATGAMHSPHHARPEDIARHSGRYDAGWDAIREERLARQKRLGIVPEGTRLAGYDDHVVAWADLDPTRRELAARFQEIYAAFLDNLDRNIGRLVGHLERTGQLDNTLFVLLADNGGSRGGGPHGRAIDMRLFSDAGNDLAFNLSVMSELGSVTTSPDYPLGWSQVSNTPLARGKSTLYGGGVRSPLIVHWPRRIRARGELRGQFHHVTDLAPTILEAIGVEAPERWRGRTVRPMDGVSMSYSFDAAGAPGRRRDQYYEMAGHRAFATRDGWKIVAYADNKDTYTGPWHEAPWQLYRTDRDVSETRDLAGRHPEKVAELEARWWRAAERNRVLPIDDRVYSSRADRSGLFDSRSRVVPAGTETLPLAAAPFTQGRNFSIRATIRRESVQQQGVIVAHGDLAGGYTLYVQRNRLHYELNFTGDRHRLSSSELPPGEIAVAFVFERTGPGLAGTGHLEVAGRRVASGPLPAGGVLSWEGLDVGRDLRLPVTQDYRAPFAFEGALEEVVFDFP